MIVSLIIPSFYPATIYGGPIFSTFSTCKALARLPGVDVRVSTTNTNMYSKLDVPTENWVELEAHLHVRYYNETVVDKFSLALFLNIWRDIKNADVVHIQSIFNTPTPWSLFFATLMKKPILLSPRGSLGLWCVEHGNRFKKIWLKYLIAPFAKRVIWHATAEQEKAEILSIFPKAKVQIIPNGIDYEAFQKSNVLSKQEFCEKFAGIFASPEKIVISMGRLQEKKGFDILIDAFVNVLHVIPNALLFIAGDDEGEKSNLLKQIADLDLQDHIFFIGSVSGQDKVDFFANANLFVLPSHNENFGNVYLESLAAGTPVVASTNTPWQMVEEAKCGKWVPNTSAETAVAILEMLKENTDETRSNAKVLASQYSWASIATRFLEIFKSMEKR